MEPHEFTLPPASGNTEYFEAVALPTPVTPATEWPPWQWFLYFIRRLLAVLVKAIDQLLA